MTDQLFTSAEFYNYLNEHKLMGTRCKSCGAVTLPPRPICPVCKAHESEWVELSGKATLVAFTVVNIAPTMMLNAGYGRKNPYCTGIVRVEEDALMSAQILDVDVNNPEQIKIGTPLEVAFVERGEGDEKQTYLAFKPVA